MEYKMRISTNAINRRKSSIAFRLLVIRSNKCKGRCGVNFNRPSWYVISDLSTVDVWYGTIYKFSKRETIREDEKKIQFELTDILQ
jgi:hypothetical protein